MNTAVLVSSVMNRLSEATTLMRQSWLRRLTLAMLLIPVFRPEGVGSQDADFPLNAAEVGALVRATAEAVDSPGLAAAIVDRGGRILAIYARPAASPLAPDTAVTIARAAAMFSNGDAPLSARTVRYISGVHFPPGVPNTPNAALAATLRTEYQAGRLARYASFRATNRTYEVQPVGRSGVTGTIR